MVQRSHTQDREGARDRWTLRDDSLPAAWRDLRQHHQLARLDGADHGIEQAVGVAAVLAGPQRLVEVRQHPDVPATGELGDEVADTRVQLTHVRRAGVQRRGGSLEDERRVDHAGERRADEHRLADAVLADQCQRPSRRLRQRLANPFDDQLAVAD